MADRGNVLNAEDQRSLSELLSDVVRDMGFMVRAELRLARTELSEQARKSGRAAGLFGGAAVTGLFAGACFVTACIAALALVIPLWLAALAVGILLGVAAAGTYAAGRERLKEVDVAPQKTVETVQQNIEWAKRRNR
jgi:Flp pilus assembly protein TadB